LKRKDYYRKHIGGLNLIFGNPTVAPPAGFSVILSFMNISKRIFIKIFSSLNAESENKKNWILDIFSAF
jgi:hypothetical protein